MEGLTQSQRREVVGLILSLTSNVTINPGDLTELRERVSALESANASLNEIIKGVLDQLVDLAQKLGNAAGAVVDLRGELNSLTASVQTIQSSLGSLTDSISDLSSQVTTNASSPTNLRSMVAGLIADVTNLKRDVSNQGLQMTSLEQRVTSLESGTGSIPTFAAPLKLDGGIVSLDLDPYFCSVDHNLTSYSASALLMNFQWLVRGEGGSSDSFDMNVTAHSHGQRTDFMMSTTQSLTVTGNSVTLVFDLNALISPPSDYSRLIPCHGFQQATFPVDLSFKRDDVTHSYQVYGSYTTPRIFKITFSPGNPVPAVIRFITVRTGIDT
ncbi:sigma-C protein [Avian orthoreovirus]|uniref:Sigma-C protein n=1 Tax=Avian orthoreovirus TaxID=38170 RepID=E7AXT6_9REOV|nr:sigma-C protein [Avian orthoreovirus]CBX25029.1 sigma-C protein [Avian orthoreovirus]